VGWYPCQEGSTSAGFQFCNKTKTMAERIEDLVHQVNISTEAGKQLTARQSPQITRLGIPAYYWGTNAIHGLYCTTCSASIFTTQPTSCRRAERAVPEGRQVPHLLPRALLPRRHVQHVDGERYGCGNRRGAARVLQRTGLPPAALPSHALCCFFYAASYYSGPNSAAA
jgi:hypothetical protein